LWSGLASLGRRLHEFAVWERLAVLRKRWRSMIIMRKRGWSLAVLGRILSSLVRGKDWWEAFAVLG
jgi:hypothetical protein